MFKVGEKYSVHEMSGGEFRTAYDGFYAVVDGKMEALSMWQDELASELMEEEGLSEAQAYAVAKEDILEHLPMTYEGSKNIATFQGIPPVGPGKAFDFYSTFECIDIWRDESEK